MDVIEVYRQMQLEKYSEIEQAAKNLLAEARKQGIPDSQTRRVLKRALLGDRFRTKRDIEVVRHVVNMIQGVLDD